jgi:SAM-dependent methyltransferase
MSNGLRAVLVAQFRRPEGALGHLAGWIMSRRGSNVERNRWTLTLLDVAPEHRVLEIGFGPGLAVAEAARRASRGHVVGVDHSAVMLRQASRRNREAIAAGRVELHLAPAGALPDLGPPFDRIFSVNCLMFWPEPVEILRSLRERLTPAGVMAVTHQPRKPGADQADVGRAADEIAAQLEAAGFEPFRCETLPLRPVSAACVLARRR